MLVFFMHGVATRDVLYAHPLQELIQQEFTQRQVVLPHFYASFWGDVLSDVGKLWNAVHQNLQAFKSTHPDADLDDTFRYQNFRKGFFSEFVGDAFTYLNSERGVKIRRLLTEQLQDFISRNPHETELHIIAHSLGTVVLWDALFSDRFQPDDPAFILREMIQGSSQLRLCSLTTMGSPIAFFNMMLGITPEQIKASVQQYGDRPLRWLNLIHGSDIIAYPIQACLTPDSSWNLVLQDHYLQTPANTTETTLHQWVSSSWVQQASKVLNPTVQIAVDHAPMVAGAADGHVNYWSCLQVAQLISDHLLTNADRSTSAPPLFAAAIAYLQQLPGMTPDRLQLSQLIDEVLIELKFHDQSGSLRLTKNLAGIHHAYVLDSQNTCHFGGYVGWMHVSGLKQAVAEIQTKFCS
jgi:hypothetical protein